MTIVALVSGMFTKVVTVKNVRLEYKKVVAGEWGGAGYDDGGRYNVTIKGLCQRACE
tara:strand:- start:652 stop:822 length:171 start_codon:yes stop_codon:yes gene_type:complete